MSEIGYCLFRDEISGCPHRTGSLYSHERDETLCKTGGVGCLSKAILEENNFDLLIKRALMRRGAPCQQ